MVPHPRKLLDGHQRRSVRRLLLKDSSSVSYTPFRVNTSTGKLSGSLGALAQRSAGGGAIEASAIYKSGSFYYLFTSWDKCCSGTSSTYNIRVGRSSRCAAWISSIDCTLTTDQFDRPIRRPSWCSFNQWWRYFGSRHTRFRA
jgi:hypothetical protein